MASACSSNAVRVSSLMPPASASSRQPVPPQRASNVNRMVCPVPLGMVDCADGVTGASPVRLQSRENDHREKPVGRVGRIHPRVEVKLVDANPGGVVPAGTPGDLLTRGYSVMLGYWNNDEATRKAIDAA